MSEKEYEIEYNSISDTYTVKEKKPYESSDSEPSTAPTAREKMGERMRNMSKKNKIIFTLLFDLYGSLYRIGGNTTIGFLFGLFDLIILKPLMFCVFSFIGDLETFEDFISFIILSGVIYGIWIIDLISVIKHDDIKFIGMKRYGDYK